MPDPKSVELLTESEKVPLLQAYTEGPIAMLDAVTAIVAAREAAARREAEDDPAHARMYRALVERAERAEAKVATARREAWDEGAEASYEWCIGVTGRPDNPYRARLIGAALAEPERDEEGGR